MVEYNTTCPIRLVGINDDPEDSMSNGHKPALSDNGGHHGTNTHPARQKKTPTTYLFLDSALDKFFPLLP